MKILSNILNEQKFVHPHSLAGQAVTRHHGDGMVSGPYLVCYESSDKPRELSGPAPGSCHFFLIDLYTGSRFNIKTSDKFAQLNTELRIMEAK